MHNINHSFNDRGDNTFAGVQGGSDRKYIVLLKQYENAQHQSL